MRLALLIMLLWFVPPLPSLVPPAALLLAITTVAAVRSARLATRP